MASDVAVQSLVFQPDGSFYAEQRDITANVVVLRQAMVSPGVLDEMLSEVRDSVRELLDAALEKMNEAPSRISRR